MFQAFQKGQAAYLTTRLLLGYATYRHTSHVVLALTISRLCEAGFIPAGLYCITMWYKREETSIRFAYYFVGNLTASACSGLVAYGMYVLLTYSFVLMTTNTYSSLQMRGICGLAGWQWMFIVRSSLLKMSAKETNAYQID